MVPGGEPERCPELHAPRTPRTEGELDQFAFALRIDAPEAALAGLFLTARDLDEVSEDKIKSKV